MPYPHFVEEYTRHVDEFMATYPIDEAMSLAVGGDYHQVGSIQAEILARHGLKDGMSVLDHGCGSGRTAHHLARQFPNLSYLGIDVVQPLLDYARSQSPPQFRFLRHLDLSFPVETQSVDFVLGFSVYTHLLHEETYSYLTDAKRVLKPGGRIVFSFLEFHQSAHWYIFEKTVEVRKLKPHFHLNVFIERLVIRLWADHLGLQVVSIEDCALGQTLAVLSS